jgi:peptidoglycan/LPS O-acetylase OafA/YrhL
MALACALLLALVVLPRPAASPSPLVRFLEARPLVLVGTVSYSLFLLHEPVIRWFHQHGLTLGGGALGFLVNVSVAGLACLVLSILSYRYVEAPALHRKRKSASPQVVGQPASAAP